METIHFRARISTRVPKASWYVHPEVGLAAKEKDRWLGVAVVEGIFRPMGAVREKARRLFREQETSGRERVRVQKDKACEQRP